MDDNTKDIKTVDETYCTKKKKMIHIVLSITSTTRDNGLRTRKIPYWPAILKLLTDHDKDR